MKSRITILWTLVFVRVLLNAQPPSQIYVFDLLQGESMHIANPRMVTAYNPSGYNNQPYFINENELLVSSLVSPAKTTDIYLLNLANNTKQQITATAVSEYSPTLTPSKNLISCVRVDDPATAEQHLYIYELKGQGNITKLLPDIKNVGYHTWLTEKDVALFLVNKPNQLALVNTDSKDPLIFTSDVGRCLTVNARGNLVYVHKLTEKDWYIKEYDEANHRATIISETYPGSEDFALAPNGNIIMGKGSKLFYTLPGTNTWQEIGDLKYFGIQNISRLAVKGKHIALVNNPIP